MTRNGERQLIYAMGAGFGTGYTAWFGWPTGVGIVVALFLFVGVFEWIGKFAETGSQP